MGAERCEMRVMDSMVCVACDSMVFHDGTHNIIPAEKRDELELTRSLHISALIPASHQPDLHTITSPSFPFNSKIPSNIDTPTSDPTTKKPHHPFSSCHHISLCRMYTPPCLQIFLRPLRLYTTD